MRTICPRTSYARALIPSALIDGITLVVGHKPTYEIEGAEKGKIYHGEGSIFIDCGAAYDEPLGCICLDNGKEYYIYD